MGRKLRLRAIPRRLRRGSRGSPLMAAIPKIAVLLAAALVLRLFFSLLGAGGSLADSIGNSFFRSVISSELGTGLEKSLSIFSRNSLVTGQSAILAGEPSYSFEMTPDDGFTGDFSGSDPDPAGNSADTDTENNDNTAVPETSVQPSDRDETRDGTIPVSLETGEDIPTTVDNDPDVRTVTISPSSETGYDYGSGVYIKNETSFNIDVNSYLKKKPSVDIDKDGPLILIVHTHASEAYYPDGGDIYTPTDTERTDDKNYNMIRVGDEMAEQFEARGYETVHIRDIFDYPSYTGSYTRTLEAIKKALKEHPSIQIVLDIHRDAMVSASGATYRTVAEIDGKKAAQILIVMGSSEGGLSHPKWKENLALAVRLQKQVCDDHPLLMRPINLRAERFNQHATAGSMLIEMGTSSNTLQEALYAADLFTSSFCSMLDSLKTA